MKFGISLTQFVRIALFFVLFLVGGCVPADEPDPVNPPVDATLVPATPSPSPNLPPFASQPAEIWVRPADGMVMAYIPAGEFIMGSDDGENNERPAHPVYLDAYWIDQTEVTSTMYLACLEAGDCVTPPERTYLDDPAYANHPVVYLDWDAAQDYCQQIGGRLPTEAEWEKAARGPSTGSGTGRTYPWGEEIDCDKANYGRCMDDTTPVGSYEAGRSPYGLYDMAGNVWEWTADWYSVHYYETSPVKNPTGAESGLFHTLRGGSWHTGDWNARTTDRYVDDVPILRNQIGFRCVISVNE